MKRFVIATASAMFLLAGTAAASVPYGPGLRSPIGNQFAASPYGGPGSMSATPVGLAPLVPGIDPSVLADPDLAIPGLPGGVTQLFGAVDPALAALAGAIPPVAGIVPPAAAGEVPVPIPGLTPAPTPAAPPADSKAPPARRHASTNPLSPKALQAAAAAALFQGLAPTGYAAYGTASVIHVDALQVGTQRLANLDAAFSGATFASAPLAQATTNEMARIVAPALAAGNAFGRGSGLEVGVAIDQSGQNQVIPGSVAEAKAPPSTDLVTKEVGPVNVDPLLGASLLRGQAQSKANAACTTGTDLSYGLGYAANLGLIGSPGTPTVSTTAATPERSVSQSRSHTFLVPQEGVSTPIRKFGLASETRETIAPITFFKGTPQQFTLEFAGEWVLRTVADGKTGKVFYGPGTVSPETPLVRILDKDGNLMSGVQQITSQTLFGPNGLDVDVPGLAHLTIGGPPRMIGGAVNSKPVETATLAAAAVDVVSVQLLNTAGARLADVRVGHMENATAVPAGGIECGIGLVKKTDKDVIGPGDDFNWTVTVTNPNDCVLTKLKVVDTVTASPGIIWTIDSATPAANQKANSGLTWNDVGPLNPGQSKDLLIHVNVGPKSGGGKFLDEAMASGVCGPAAGTAGADAAVGVPLEARVSLNLPEVNVALGALLPRELPRTGGVLAVIPALALTGGGLVLRQSKRRKRKTA
ncbi:MAG TPA: hypothetical protein VGR20_01650 [Acidimicrobiia bacterium]|nr:hypothetical protein [Acidimicrobiia bacterium]